MGILGASLGTLWRGLENDVFAQIGLLMLVGLASKNAILVVEFAEQLRHESELAPLEAIVHASSTRLRPILMTSCAFVLGMLPLYLASGAGQNARHSLGTTVLWGMVVSTVLNLYVVPACYLAVVRATALVRRALSPQPTATPVSATTSS
jgi:HAE1 family hydrophobic/amphiphilic exporter-1